MPPGYNQLYKLFCQQMCLYPPQAHHGRTAAGVVITAQGQGSLQVQQLECVVPLLLHPGELKLNTVSMHLANQP